MTDMLRGLTAPSPEAGANILMVAAFGFLASFHCIGMCGGIILSQCARRRVLPAPSLSVAAPRDERRKNTSALFAALTYNAGRVASYTLTGLIAGALGGVVSMNPYLAKLIPALCAIIMIAAGLTQLGLFRSLRGAIKIPAAGLIKKIQKRGVFIVGFATGFLPCGMLQTAQLHALGSGNAFMGAAAMCVFAIASSPALFAFGALGGVLTAEKRGIALKIAAVIVIVMGVRMLLRVFSGGHGGH